jgi:hypothetical protein
MISLIQCTPEIQLSPMQKRQITTRLFEGNYENAFRASITVLQDQGYVIKNTDMASGLILATVDRQTATVNQVAQILLLGFAFDKGTEVEVSCVVNRLNEFSSEIRINIQEVKYGQSSWLSGTSKQNSKQVYDPRLYQNIFNEISLEIKRREALDGISADPQTSKKRDLTARSEESRLAVLSKTQEVVVHLKDETLVKGIISAQNDTSIIIKTSIGELKIERTKITSIEPDYKYTTVYLKDGTIIKGEVIEANLSFIVVKTSLGKININRKKILRLDGFEDK